MILKLNYTSKRAIPKFLLRLFYNLKEMAKLKYCPHCQQNVAVVTRPTTAAILLTFIGFPFLVASNSFNKSAWRVAAPSAGIAVLSIALFLLLFKISFCIAIVALFLRKSYCPICRTPNKFLHSSKVT